MNTTKLPIAEVSPSIRLEMIGPGPWARNDASDGWAVIEFHSWMFRIQSAAPFEDVGEIEPNTDSWRAHHGPMTTMNSANAAMPAMSEIGGRSSTWLHEPCPRRARHQRTRSASHTS